MFFNRGMATFLDRLVASVELNA